MMNQTKKAFASLVLTFAILAASVPAVPASFDEGMYPPDQIGRLPLKKRGLKIDPIEIYNPAGGGLSEAVPRLSIGCTSEFVSPDGLILTNHHCAFDALVSASSPGRDVVETGFRTDGRSGEIPAKGYSIFIPQRVENVTDRVRQGTENLTGAALAAALKKNTDDLQAAEQTKAPAGSTVRVQALNNGLYYYLYQNKEIKDIRIVYAPPRSIGIFGGDPDNFEWPRQTGDFAFLRAYTAPDGSSAAYAPNNVPYKSAKFLTMNIGGLSEGDFAFVLGYPGSTTRYRESQSIAYARDANFPFLADYLEARSDALRLIGRTDEKKRIEFQSDIANFDNYRKVYRGGAEKLRKADVVARRQAEEAKLAAWINADPQRSQKYGTVLDDLKRLSEETNAASRRDVIIGRFPSPALTPVLKAIVDAMNATRVQQGKSFSDAEKAAKLAEIQKLYEGREPVYEREMIKFFLRQLADLPDGQKFDAAEKLFGSLQGEARRSAEAQFAESIATGEYASPEKVAGLYGPRTMEFIQERENILSFATELAKERNALAARTANFASQIDPLRLRYQQAMAEMKGVSPYPDANSTLWFAYGNVKGYSPQEAVIKTPFTTVNGMIEKDTGIPPFDVPEKLKELQTARDFGRYGSGGTVPLNFLSDIDIIGGNSGSPVLNGRGEQVGLVFDGNYEGLGNDLFYDTEKGRTIAVDIRFILFVLEKFANSGWILNEMKIVGGPKAQTAARR